MNHFNIKTGYNHSMKTLKVFNIVLILAMSLGMNAQDTSARKKSVNQPATKDSVTEFPRFRLIKKHDVLGASRLNSVEDMGIFEGKKTDLVLPDKFPVNLSTNNARQVFSRVVGLNIWENDGAGLQMSIGGRGLDPNRSSNFNVRQNGYDISADALGYPESYYTPPMEAVGKIQVVRGASSLQYGTQFGGLVNFIMREPVKDRTFSVTARQTLGSFGFYNAFTSMSGTKGKFSYYVFGQYKKMDGWRPNSSLNNTTFYANFNYQISQKSILKFDYTRTKYLSQQPGGLSDAMFNSDPRQSNRERNWFDVNWNLFALHFNHKFSINSEFNLRVFALLAHRYSIGFRPLRVSTIDNGSERDLIKGNFKNLGLEARYLKHYKLLNKSSVVLTGIRIYNGYNHSVQGLGSKGSDANFNFVESEHSIGSDYEFPNFNASAFAENILHLSSRFSITPGLRFEYIQTKAKGYYKTVQYDLAGNVISSTRTDENRNNPRHFVIAGLGLSYKPNKKLELYGNITQNYRSITFSDMRISNPSQVIDPNLKDEKGHSLDFGFRTSNSRTISFDISAFVVNYNNRIGEIQAYDQFNKIYRLRTNIGRSSMKGIETYMETDILRLLRLYNSKMQLSYYINAAYIHARYVSSELNGVAGKYVEFVPDMNLKTGLSFAFNKFRFSTQLTYLTQQYTDASNAVDGGVSGVVGIIPSYYVADASLSYKFKRLVIELSTNNLTNNMYFTRRATGYPGPGILPSDGRSFFVTLGYSL